MFPVVNQHQLEMGHLKWPAVPASKVFYMAYKLSTYPQGCVSKNTKETGGEPEIKLCNRRRFLIQN